MLRENLRNIAIIAHVDHGKTTLVDQMLRQSGYYRQNQTVAERVMDSGDLERERGITILAKNASVTYKGIKINIVDTPGHADFGGEVERVLGMVDGVLLLVDAAEGPMPQTRFVLSHALDLGLPVITVINKIDRPDARSYEVVDMVLELMIDLGSDESCLDGPVLFASGRAGTAGLSPAGPMEDLDPLFDAIFEHIPAPEVDTEEALQLCISTVDYNDFVGRIGIGRIARGRIEVNQDVTVCDYHDEAFSKKGRITALYTFEGTERVAVQSAEAGEIVAISGLEDVQIGNTLCRTDTPDPLPFVKISEPTVAMTFYVNDSPLAGREGKFVTSRQLRARLYREGMKDLSLKVEDGDTTESWSVMGRGEMHLGILIENMRREGYEFAVGPARALMRQEEGRTLEPFEIMTADLPETYSGAVIGEMGRRGGEMLSMEPVGSRVRVSFRVPARGLFGYRSEFLTRTHGEGIMNTLFDSYGPYRGELPGRSTGSLIAFEAGESVTYGLYGAQERGELFIEAGVPVYAGMVVGATPTGDDLVVNVCKKKQLTNTRASGSDDALRLVPPRKMSLEAAIEFLASDEMLEVTPVSVRIRKRQLDHAQRMRDLKKEK